MKVDGPKSSQSVSKGKKSDKSSGSDDGDFAKLVGNTAGEAEQSAASHSIARVDGLLAVQAAEDPIQGERRKRMTSRANDILDELDVIKMALLNGNLRASQIEDVSRLVAVSRENVDDPNLSAVLDEIDLRAHVEMAKLEAAKTQALKHLQENRI